jgi:spore coat polysaccharide biosynthesis protein SpsF
VVVATTVEPADIVIADLVSGLGYAFFRGSENDVLDRYYQAARTHAPDYVVRITSDCPLIDPDLVDQIIERALETGADYASNCLERSYPDGTDTEVFKFSALERAWREASEPSQREHVTPYIVAHSDQRDGLLFRAVSVKNDRDFSNVRLTVDYPEDVELIKFLIGALGDGQGWQTYADYLVHHPDIFALNQRAG